MHTHKLSGTLCQLYGINLRNDQLFASSAGQVLRATVRDLFFPGWVRGKLKNSHWMTVWLSHLNAVELLLRRSVFASIPEWLAAHDRDVTCFPLSGSRPMFADLQVAPR